MFTIIYQLIVGLIIGLIARALLPGKEPIADGALGWLLTALIGIGGAFIGTMIGKVLFFGAGYTAGWIMSVVGAILLLLLVRFITNKRAE